MRRWLFIALLLLAPAARAQYFLYQNCQLQTAQGQAVAGAQVYFLTQPANTTALTPLATIYSNSTGTVATQPIKTNGFGQCSAYLNSGVYTVVYVSPLTGKLVYPDQLVGTPNSNGNFVYLSKYATASPVTCYNITWPHAGCIDTTAGIQAAFVAAAALHTSVIEDPPPANTAYFFTHIVMTQGNAGLTCTPSQYLYGSFIQIPGTNQDGFVTDPAVGTTGYVDYWLMDGCRIYGDFTHTSTTGSGLVFNSRYGERSEIHRTTVSSWPNNGLFLQYGSDPFVVLNYEGSDNGFGSGGGCGANLTKTGGDPWNMVKFDAGSFDDDATGGLCLNTGSNYFTTDVFNFSNLKGEARATNPDQTSIGPLVVINNINGSPISIDGLTGVVTNGQAPIGTATASGCNGTTCNLSVQTSNYGNNTPPHAGQHGLISGNSSSPINSVFLITGVSGGIITGTQTTAASNSSGSGGNIFWDTQVDSAVKITGSSANLRINRVSLQGGTDSILGDQFGYAVAIHDTANSFSVPLSAIPNNTSSVGASWNTGVYEYPFFCVDAACWNNSIVYATTGSSLATLCASFSGSPGTVVVPVPVTQTSTTLPANCSIVVLNGGTITATGGTLTILGNFTAPPNAHVFTGTIAGLTTVRPEWGAWTVFQAANALSTTTGGTVLLQNAVYQAGFSGTEITANNVTIKGTQTPQVNSGLTAFISNSGSVIQGSVGFIGSNITYSDFGVDIGDTFNHCTDNGLSVTPNTITAPMLYNIRVRNITVVACDHTFSPSAQQHDLLFEHITGLTEENILTYNGYYGNVVKAINVSETNIVNNNAFASCSIVKSDDVFGVSTNVQINGQWCLGGAQFVIDTFGGTVSGLTINGFYATGMTNGAILGNVVADGANPGVINGVTITNGNINTTGFDAILFPPGSININISNFNISNITGNGIVFQSLGASGNSTTNIKYNTLSGYGSYFFGQTDTSIGITCTSVTNGCLAVSGSSGQHGLVRYSNVLSDTAYTFAFVNGSFLLADQFSWQTPSLINGWTASGGSNSIPLYRLDRNYVRLKGLIVPGTSTTVYTLPPGFRPLEVERFAADGYTGSAFVMCEILVSTTGVVTVTNYTTCGSSYVSLDGITFPVN